MSLVRPKKGERKDEFVSRYMCNKTMETKFPDNDERLTECLARWDESKEGKAMDQINTVERRYLTMELRLHTDDDGEEKIQGYAARFNKWGDGYWFREKIAPGAFTQTLKDKDDVRALFNHNPDFPLGRTGISGDGNLELREDKKGLWMELNPTDTSFARDLKTNIEAGVVSQQSFGFEVRKDEWKYFQGEEDKPAERILRDVKLFDVSPVTYPFYTDTTVALRSLDKWKVENGIVNEAVDDATDDTTDETADSVDDAEVDTEVRTIINNLNISVTEDEIAAVIETLRATADTEIKSDSNEKNTSETESKTIADIKNMELDKPIIVDLDSFTMFVEDINEEVILKEMSEEINQAITNLRKTDDTESADSDALSPSENSLNGDNAQSADKALQRQRQFEFEEGEYNFSSRYRTSGVKSNRYSA